MYEHEVPAGDPQNAGAALPVASLYRRADLSTLRFETTRDLEPLEGVTGQDRALGAIRLAAGIEKPGFNLFAIGRPEAQMREAVNAVLEQTAAGRPTPADWVYVNNFADARRPIAITLPAGRAPEFRDAMEELIGNLEAAVPAVFESEEYQTQRGAIDEAFQKQQMEAFAALEQKAGEKGVALLRTPIGFTLVPASNGQVVPPDEFNSWPEARRKQTQVDISSLEADLEHVVHQIPQREKKRRQAVRQLNRRTAESAVGHLIDETRTAFADNPAITRHLDCVRADLVDNVAMFVADGTLPESDAQEAMEGGPFERYAVNVMVTHPADGPTPVIEEPHPTLANLLGVIEHRTQDGVLVTNFRLIRPGSLHRANGGCLFLDVRHLLMEPFSWPALKRALRRREIVTEDVSRLIGLTTTVSLEPDPIPLDLKVVLFGDRLLYVLLSALDPELAEHFKVLADFDDEVDRSPESETVLARCVAAMAEKDGLSPLDREAVALVIEHAARLTDDSAKLTLLLDQIRDLLVEADFWARDAGRAAVTRAEVARAIAEGRLRAGRLRDRIQESMLKKVALIDTSGERTGQVNGLSVYEIGGFTFGRPTRITCQVRPGGGELVDIEREVELGGPIHSKGVLILAGFLAGRYALDTPMSLRASLVFEQSYGGVEGDSASAAELCALLSGLADLPLRQDLAVTGSINQHGDVQAVGGVNDKIEGFFDLCMARGLTGVQGVIIPAGNVQHLMLRSDVVEACAAGRFAIYAATNIDDVLALLTGKEAGRRGSDGRYPDGSVNRRVEDQLRAFAQIRRAFGAGEPSVGGGQPARR